MKHAENLEGNEDPLERVVPCQKSPSFREKPQSFHQFPPVSTSFPGPNSPGTVSSGATMAAAEKAGATSFAAMAKGAADSTPSFDVVSVGCVRLYVVYDVDVVSVWLDVWCRFFVLVCFDYGSFLYVCWGKLRWVAHGFASSWKSGWSL